MTTRSKDPVFVALQMSGCNDYTVLEKWFGLDPVPIVGGTLEHPDFL